MMRTMGIDATHRHARARRDHVDRRAVLRPDPRRSRGGRDQGRAPGDGRRRPRLGPAVLERRGGDVPLGEREQALARDLAARSTRPRRDPPARGDGGRVPPEPAARARRRASASAPSRCGARNERLVYCSVGAYGHVGPLREEAGYDALMQAAGGLISMTGEPDRPGVRVGSSLIDQGTGTWAALGILAALLERERTGDRLGGRRLALRDRARLHRLPPHRAPRRRHHPARPGNAVPDGRAVPGVPNPRRRADDRGGNDRLFAAICEVLGLPEPRHRRALRSRIPTGFAIATRSARSSRSGSRRHDTDALAGRALAAGVPGGSRRRRRRHPRLASDRGARDHAAARAPLDRRASRRRRSRCRSTASAPLHRTAPRQPSARTQTQSCVSVGFTDDELAALAAEGVIRR